MADPEKPAPEVRGSRGKIVAARGGVVSGRVLAVLVVSLLLGLIAATVMPEYFRSEGPKSVPATNNAPSGEAPQR